MSAKQPPPGVVKFDESNLFEGAGVYSPETEAVMRCTMAQALVLCILGGNRGTGFDISVRSDCVSNVVWHDLAGELDRLARVLRERAGPIFTEAAKQDGG